MIIPPAYHSRGGIKLLLRLAAEIAGDAGGWISAGILHQAQLVPIPGPASATLDQGGELPVAQIYVDGAGTPASDAKLVLGEFLGSDAAPAEDVEDLGLLSSRSQGPMRVLPSGAMKCTDQSLDEMLTRTRGMGES